MRSFRTPGAGRLGAVAAAGAALALGVLPSAGETAAPAGDASPAGGAASPARGPSSPATTAVDRYRGYVSLFGDPVRSASQGAGWTLSFRERVRGRVRYKACLKHLGPPQVSRCWRRRSRIANRRQDVFVALYVNDVGGAGRWRARWFVRGRRVAQWRFRVRPERVGP